MFNYRRRNKTIGLTLIEVLIVISLSLFLITTITSLYLQFHRAYMQRQQLVIESLSAQKILSLLRSEINMAGQIGCARLSNDYVVQPYQQYLLNEENSLQITNNELVVRYQSTPTNMLIVMESPRTFVMDNDINIIPNQIMIISDCTHAEIFEVKSVNVVMGKLHITAKQPLRYNFGAHAELGRLIQHHYYIKNNNLMLENSSGRDDVLQRGISQLQFQKDKKGLKFSFKTDSWQWYGYAKKS